MKYFALLISLFFSQFTFSLDLETCQINNAKVGFAGLDGPDSRIFSNISGHQTTGCSCSHVRFLPHKADTDKVLSLLLAARFSDKTVRIDLLDATNCNSAYRVYIE